MQTDNNKRWENIYDNVLSEGKRLKRKKRMVKVFSTAAFMLVLVTTIFIKDSFKEETEEFFNGYAYIEDNVEIALIAQGVFFDEEFGLLME